MQGNVQNQKMVSFSECGLLNLWASFVQTLCTRLNPALCFDPAVSAGTVARLGMLPATEVNSAWPSLGGCAQCVPA